MNIFTVTGNKKDLQKRFKCSSVLTVSFHLMMQHLIPPPAHEDSDILQLNYLLYNESDLWAS